MSHFQTKHDRIEGAQHSPTQGPSNDKNAAPKDPRRINLDPQDNGYDRDQLARAAVVLQDFAAQISLMTHLEAAVDRLKKKVQREAEERAKAEKRGLQFPSGISNVPDSREQLATTDQELQSHTDLLDHLTQQLAVILVSSDASESVRADIFKLQAQVAALLERKPVDQGLDVSKLAALEESIRSLQSKIDTAGNGNIPKHKISHIENQQRNLQSMIAKVESRITNGVERRIFALERQIGDYGSKFDSIEARLVSAAKSDSPSATQKLEDKVASNHEIISKEFANLRQGWVSDKASLIDSIAKNRAEVEAKIAATPDARPTQTPSSEDLDKLESNQQNLFNQFESLRKDHDDRDAIVAEEIEKIHMSESRLANDLGTVSQNIDTLRKDVDLLKQRTTVTPPQTASQNTTSGPDPETQKQLQDIRDAYDKVQGSLNEQVKSYGYALRSLQANFANMTSEPIARQMVNAVSSLYPLPRLQGDIDGLCKDVISLRAICNNVMQNLKTLGTRLDSQERSLRKANEERAISIQEMNIERDRISSQIDALRTRVEQLEQGLQKCATLEQISLERNNQTAEMTTIKSRQDDMEEITAKRLADALGKIEAFEQYASRLDKMEQEMESMRRENEQIRNDNAELLSVIRRFEPEAREEALARYEEAARMRDQEENQVSDQEGERERLVMQFQARQNGHQASREPSRSHASSNGSESSADSPSRESVPPGAPLDSRASYRLKRRGWQSAISSPSHPTKKPKRGGGSLHYRVSRG